jgi:beta-glucosidase
MVDQDFWWGVATSSYQIEGAVDADGRGPSIWDTFTHAGDHIVDDSTGDVACDHYHRWSADADLMAQLGVGAYRFSIAWPRIQPDGQGSANAGGLGFYDRLVDGLLERGIAPAATLFHWDLPQAVQDAGGWSARDTAYRFADYAGQVSARLGDRVRLWLTLNEPAVHTVYGHIWGIHAPGQQLFEDPFPVMHHQLLGHGLATAAIRATSTAPVGIANNYAPAWAVGPDGTRESATDEDRAAADAFDAVYNHAYTDPILAGTYPEALETFRGAHRLADGSLVHEGDLATIAAPIDALGVNYYNPTGVGAPSWAGPLPYDMRIIAGYPTTYFGWPVVPAGLTETLVGLRDRYGVALPPIYITENGCSYEDRPGPDGVVDDTDRIAFYDAHIAAVDAAVASGVDVRGYFAWSFMDNFEWAEGYTKRFGLVHVDFATQQRTPKASFHWYRDRITRGL